MTTATLTTTTKNGTKAKAKTAPRAKRVDAHSVTAWSTFGVCFTLGLSAALNGYANSQHAPNALAGWMMGVSIPVLVLVLSKVAGEKWLKGHKFPARLAGGSGLSLLALSVYHCAESIALLTGSPLWLALPMSVSIDVGLVACEVALITEGMKRK